MVIRIPPANSVSWMKQLAGDKRKRLESEMDHLALIFAEGLRKITLDRNRLYEREGIMEAFFQGVNEQCIKMLGWSPGQAFYVQKKILHLVYGDPKMAMSSGMRHHAIPYWNPTPHRLNIAPMGIVKSVDEKTREAKLWDFVEPGEQVMIPESYTVGGRHSTLYGTAPQLRPLPQMEDYFLDLEPLTYTEWCSFMDGDLLSPCCGKQIMWYDRGQRLMCSKCGQGCKGMSF